MKKNSRSRKSKKSAGPRRPRGEVSITHPPAINNYSVVHNRRLRFNCITVFNGEISFQNLLDTMLVATSAIAGYDIFTAVRIRFIEVWANPSPVSITPNTVTIVFNGNGAGFVGDNRVHTDTSMGLMPAHIRCRPAKGTMAGMFQTSSAQGAFDLSCPVGTIIDVGLTFTQSLQLTTQVAQNALVGATTGAVYTRGLDGVAVGATKLISAVPNSV